MKGKTFKKVTYFGIFTAHTIIFKTAESQKTMVRTKFFL